MPAIRGLGGSVIRFIDEASGLSDDCSVEFTATGNGGPDSGLTRIGHFAQTMSSDAMLIWLLLYTTLFEMGKSAMVDVVDPGGLVRSQALAAPHGAFRLALNGAETHRTMVGTFLADSFGASVQHIALATDDIFATADALAARGFRSLPVSEND